MCYRVIIRHTRRGKKNIILTFSHLKKSHFDPFALRAQHKTRLSKQVTFGKPSDSFLQSSALAKRELPRPKKMKKKMCIKLSVNCDRCRRKAMEVAVNAKGVISVAIEGESEDELVVVGDGIDAASLVDTLRKKACYAILETLEEVSPDILTPDDDQVEKPQEEDDTNNSDNIETADDASNGTDQNVPPHCCLAQCSTICYEHPQHPEMYEVVVYDSYGPTTGCTIM